MKASPINNVVLVGFMGSGKSRVGGALAGLAQCDHVDLDERIEARAGITISQIFGDFGEETFRSWETDALAEWLGAPKGILSTGGGIIETEINRQALRRHYPVVWLDPSFDQLRDRLGRAPRKQRPLVESLGWSALRALRDRRRPLYASCADFRMQETRPSAHAMAVAIRRILQEAQGS